MCAFEDRLTCLSIDEPPAGRRLLGQLQSSAWVQPQMQMAVERSLWFVGPGSRGLLEDSWVDDLVEYSRPSIDVLFESAARAYGREVLAVLLTGYGRDGTHGMAAVRDAGGTTIAEDPETALQATMPRHAIDAGAACEVLTRDAIPARLVELCKVAA